MFDSWAEILRVMIIGSVSYGALVALLGASGKRTVGQLNAFDFIVTVAFCEGSAAHAQLRRNRLSESEVLQATAPRVRSRSVATCQMYPNITAAISRREPS